MFWKKKKRIVTHSGSFHTDDVFAAATIALYFHKTKTPFKLERTNDQIKIEQADIVFDIGGIYDESKNRFDHHQKSGAGERLNGIPYASFGLVWKKYGPEICDNQEVVDIVDQYLVQSIDAEDNGIDIYHKVYPDVSPFSISRVLNVYNLTFEEHIEFSDFQFQKAVSVARDFLERFIYKTKIQQQVNNRVREIYHQTSDKRVLVIDEHFGRNPITQAVIPLEEVVYFVYPSNRGKEWNICAKRINVDSFESKKPFPESWRGLRSEDLVTVSRVSSATFCHNSGFLCGAISKEDAILLAQKALQS